VRRRTEVEYVDIDGELVAYDPSRRALHRLNATAADIWRACDGATAGAIVERLQRAYPADPGAVAHDVMRALQWLRDERLVEVRG
jgi:hypothetical protein